jgi:hypothetical protein
MNIKDLKSKIPFIRFSSEAKPTEPIKEKEEMAAEGSDTESQRTIFIDAKNIWITNDGLLRDEGVLFGLSSANTEEKTNAIKNFYAELKAAAEGKRSAIDKTLETLHVQWSQLGIRKESLSPTSGEQELVKPDTHFARNLLGLIFITSACIGNFYLIHYFVSPRFGIAASVGIFLFGLFSLIAPLSTWLDPEAEENRTFMGKLKTGLLEIGSPLATTIFVSYIVYEQTDKFGFTIVFGLFLFFLFFFCGKLLLGVFHNVAKELSVIKAYLLKVREIKKKSESDLSKDENLLKELLTLNQKIENLQAESSSLAAQCTGYDQQCELKINLFLSEYQLAKNYAANPNT